MIKAVVIWVIGLFTIVPYGTYYLFFEATRDQYAFLITMVLFWIFGYWGVVAPSLAAWRLYGVMQIIDAADDTESLKRTVHCEETKEAAIDLIASENNIPRFAAAWLYRKTVKLIQDHVEEEKKKANLE